MSLLTMLPLFYSRRDMENRRQYILVFNIIKNLFIKILQESVKDGKPKFFLNNAGEVIRRIGKLKCSTKVIFLVY